MVKESQETVLLSNIIDFKKKIKIVVEKEHTKTSILHR